MGLSCCHECVGTTKDSSQLQIQEWKGLPTEHGGFEIWNDYKNTTAILNGIAGGGYAGIKFHFNPHKGMLKVTWHDDVLANYIPYIDYPVYDYHTTSTIPPSLRIARRDLWSPKLLPSILQFELDKKKKESRKRRATTN